MALFGSYDRNFHPEKPKTWIVQLKVCCALKTNRKIRFHPTRSPILFRRTHPGTSALALSSLQVCTVATPPHGRTFAIGSKSFSPHQSGRPSPSGFEEPQRGRCPASHAHVLAVCGRTASDLPVLDGICPLVGKSDLPRGAEDASFAAIGEVDRSAVLDHVSS